MTALAAILSSFSEDTLASISEMFFAAPRILNSASAACARLCPAPATLCPGMPRTPRGHRVALLVDYAPRRSLDGVSTGPLLVSACISLRGCLSCPWPIRSLHCVAIHIIPRVVLSFVPVLYMVVAAGTKYQDFSRVRAYALEPESRARVLCARASDPSQSPLHSIRRWTIRCQLPNSLANPSTHPCRSVAEHLLVHAAELYHIQGSPPGSG